MSVSDRIAVMNAGRLEQMAPPEEIYARPSTLFVASFIGTMNRVDAVQSGAELVAGPFRATTQVAGGYGAGALVVGIRPEDLVLEARGDGAPAEIESAIDLGHYRRVALRAGGMSLLAFVPKGDPMPVDGATVRAQRMLVYRDGLLADVVENVRSPITTR